MGVFDKIKNVLFTEEDETEEIPVINTTTKEVEEEKEEQPRFRKVVFQEEARFDEKPIEIEKEEVKERTVETPVVEKSPFQSFDEEEFDRIAAINKNRLMERDRRLREEKERSSKHLDRESTITTKVEEPHRFKPSPVISPVYGILDKNYTKEDILPTASSEGTLPKIIDVDKVRQKAFGTLENIEKDLEDEQIVEDIKITTFSDDKIDDDLKVETNEDSLNIKDEIDSIVPREEKRSKKVEEDIPIETTQDIDDSEEEEDMDNDLFNLIDSMYQSEEGE